MKNNEEECISHILKNMYMHKINSSDRLFMGTSFFISPREGVSEIEFINHHLDWVKKGIVLFKDEISNVIENPKVMTWQRKKHPFIPWVVGVEFENNFICYSQLKNVFTKLNNIFNQVNGTEKLLICYC